MDRNRRGGVLYSHAGKVALRKESVDRNIKLDVSYNIKETSLSARRAWIEIRNLCRSPQATSASLSARRAWIEIWASGRRGTGAGVALRKESVDRNRDRGPDTGIAAVALRKESVDRNARCRFWVLSNAVALRKESVDRNTSFCPASLFDLPSLSARRAWIEISGR